MHLRNINSGAEIWITLKRLAGQDDLPRRRRVTCTAHSPEPIKPGLLPTR